MPGDTVDLAVIGAGSAGFAAAIAAAEQGATVALVGHGPIGGTCVNIGCVPSKTLIRATETLYHARHASRFAGISADARLTSWPDVVAQKDTLVSELRQSKYADLLPAYEKISYVSGAARLVDGGVAVDGEAVRAGKIIVATGAAPAVPAIPGLDQVPYLTSTTALELATLPSSLLVIGGGYIGVELAQMFARAGVAVTIVCRSRLLPHGEPEISAALTEYLGDEGIRIVGGISYRAISRSGDAVSLAVATKGSEIILGAQKVLVATGRTPNTAGLGLDPAGVALDRDGGIAVDERMRTTQPGIYAAGDVTGRDQFVYMAAYGARIAAENALNGDGRSYDRSAMPAVVFTDPQIASAGFTEAAARAAGFDVKISVLPLAAVSRALAACDTRGLIKLVADKATDRLLGGHILAPEGADSIQTVVMALKAQLTVRDLTDTVFPYLTTVEGLKLAAQSFDKDVSKLSCCAG